MADDTGDEVPEGQVRMYHPKAEQWAVDTEAAFEAVWKDLGWQKRSSKAVTEKKEG